MAIFYGSIEEWLIRTDRARDDDYDDESENAMMVNATDGRTLDVGDTVQLVCTVGTNADRWYGWVDSFDRGFVNVTADCWYDVNGDRHNVTGVHRIHPDNLRKVYSS